MSKRVQTIGKHVARYGLVVVLLWVGGMKFTAHEAKGSGRWWRIARSWPPKSPSTDRRMYSIGLTHARPRANHRCRGRGRLSGFRYGPESSERGTRCAAVRIRAVVIIMLNRNLLGERDR